MYWLCPAGELAAQESFKESAKRFAGSWQGFYLFSIKIFLTVHDIVRDKVMDKISGWSHRSVTVAVIQNAALPRLQAAPLGFDVRALLYSRLFHVLLARYTPSRIARDDVLRDASDDSGELPPGSMQQLTAIVGADVLPSKKDEAELLQDVVMEELSPFEKDVGALFDAHVWAFLGYGVLSMSTAGPKLKLRDQFIIYIGRNPRSYQDYAEFLGSAIDVPGRLEENTKWRQQLGMRPDTHFEDCLSELADATSKFPVAMRAYVEFLEALHKVRLKFFKHKPRLVKDLEETVCSLATKHDAPSHARYTHSTPTQLFSPTYSSSITFLAL